MIKKPANEDESAASRRGMTQAFALPPSLFVFMGLVLAFDGESAAEALENAEKAVMEIGACLQAMPMIRRPPVNDKITPAQQPFLAHGQLILEDEFEELGMRETIGGGFL